MLLQIHFHSRLNTWVKTTTRQDEKHLSFGIWCNLYQRFDGKLKQFVEWQILDAVKKIPHLKKHHSEWEGITWTKWWLCTVMIPNGIITPQWVNSLWPTDTIWWHRSVSTLAQIMAWCHQAPSPYLTQWWLLISDVLWHSPESNFTVPQQLFYIASLKIILLEWLPHIPGANELKP